MTSIPAVVPPLPRDQSARIAIYAPSAAVHGWRAGWRDLVAQPASSLLYGLGVFLVSAAIVGGLFAFGWDYILFPGLRRLHGRRPAPRRRPLREEPAHRGRRSRSSLAGMIFVRPASGGQILFTGVLLCLLMLLWMRAAVIIYALFFGLLPFPGLDHIAPMLFTTPTGWAMLIVGTVVGGLFAAFSFAISVFSVPMLLDERSMRSPRWAPAWRWSGTTCR